MTLSLRVVSILPNHHLSSFLKKVIGSFKVCSQPRPVTCWAWLELQIPRVTESCCGGNSIICSIFTTLWVQMDPVTRDEAELTLSSHQSIIFNKNKICFRSKHDDRLSLTIILTNPIINHITITDSQKRSDKEEESGSLYFQQASLHPWTLPFSLKVSQGTDQISLVRLKPLFSFNRQTTKVTESLRLSRQLSLEYLFFPMP